jgi:predicted dehydrogenase
MQKPSSERQPEVNRRDFLKGAAASAGVAMGVMAIEGCSGLTRVGPAATVPAFKPREVVRIGFVGVGGMGTNHCNNLLKIEGADLRAVCDIVPEKVANVQKLAEQAGKPTPVGYSAGPWDFKRMCDREDLDLVYTATPWEWHTPVCIYAMKSGKHAATEVPAAMTLEECWQLVETSEQTGRHAIMMENCCYDRSEMMVLNMVRKGLFGAIVHAAGGYMHDLRELKFSGAGEGLWRRAHGWKLDGNLYPTHGLGPLAWYTNINRGDRFDFLVSMSSAARGMQAYAAEHFPPEDPRRKEQSVLGDVNTTLMRTVNGVSIMLQHDTNLPRPYSRINLVQGTKGIFRGFPDQIYIEGRSKQHEWESPDTYQKEFAHPLWVTMQEKAKGAGHGGMDFIEDYRLVNALRRGWYPDLDVYDAATWSAVVDLSVKSVAGRSRPVDFPDFTRGKWKTAQPIPIFDADQPCRV